MISLDLPHCAASHFDQTVGSEGSRDELAALRDENARLRALSEGAFDIAALISLNGQLQTVLPATRRTLGAEFGNGACLCDWIHPDDADTLREAIARICWGEESVEIGRFRVRAANGRWLPLEGRLSDARPQVGALALNARNVTSCAKTAQALYQSEAELNSILDAAPIFVFRWNREGIYVFARGNFNTILGISPQARIGHSVYELFAHKPEIARNFERALTGETFQTTVYFEDHPFDAHYTPAYDENGEIVGVIGAAMDVSQRHAAERVLENALAQSEFEAAQTEVLDRLARAGEFRDDDTGQHTRRVGDMAARLAARCGFSPQRVETMRRAAPLHDIGKIGVPDSILLKPGKLTDDEFAIIKTHCEIGARLLADGKSELVQMAQNIALNHHERFDGKGYPHGIKGEAIPLEGRIVAVVDVFDALTSERPYKTAWPIEKALAEIQRSAGTQFDPIVVEAFLEMFESPMI